MDVKVIKTEAKVFLVEAACSNCDNGILKFIGGVYSNNTNDFWRHRCTSCKHEENLPIQYPRYEHEPIKNYRNE